MTQLLLGVELRRQIERFARAAFPRECCGLIEGAHDGGLIRAAKIHETRNIAGDNCRFEVDPLEHIGLMRAARTRGYKIVGCFHSHPNGRVELSERDREHADDEQFVWLVAALTARDAPVSLFASIVFSGAFEPLTIESDFAIGSTADKARSQ